MTQIADPPVAGEPLEPEAVTGHGLAADPEALVGTVRSHTSVPSQLAGVIAVVVPPVVVVLAMGLLWDTAFHVEDLVAMLVLYVLCGLGITVGWHRYFSHKSFETSRATRAVLAILGSMAMQGPLTQWVTDHRKHHAFSDVEGDPHSPHAGFGDSLLGRFLGLWHAHWGWLFTTKGLERGHHYGRDLYEDPLIRWIDRLYLLWVLATVGIPFLIGYLVGGTALRGVETLVWAGLVRIFVWQHITFSINSICHVFGARPFRTRDESRDVKLLALVSFGESWHNGHHAFPASAVHGLAGKQIDLSALVIRGMEKTGLAWDVRRPAAAQVDRRRAASGS